MPRACAGDVLYPEERNGHCVLVDEANRLYRVGDGTTLLVPTTAQSVVEWVRQDLFDEAVRWPSGAIESANDFLRRLLEMSTRLGARLYVYVMTVPEMPRREEPNQVVISYRVENDSVLLGGKWGERDEVMMSTAQPLGGSF